MIRRNRILFAADTAPSGAPAPAISAADSPTGVALEVTPPVVQPPPEIIQPEPVSRISKPGVKVSAIDVAKELGLKEAPSRTVERMAKAARDKLTGQFKPMPKRHPKIPAEATAAPAQKVEPTAVVPLGEPMPASAVEPKIKVGAEEKTAAEWQAHFEEQAKTTPQPAKESAPAPIDQAADDKEREEQFLTTAAERYAPTQEAFDKMLADGDTAAFGRMMATVEMNTRKWMADQINPHIERMSGQLQPLAQQQQQIAQYQTEIGFMDANPAIKAHPQGLQTMRETAAELRAEHDDLQQLIAVAQASPRRSLYEARSKALETEFLAELAKATQAKLAPTATPAAPAPVAKPRPPAQTGQVSGASTSKVGAMSNASSEIAQMRARNLM